MLPPKELVNYTNRLSHNVTSSLGSRKSTMKKWNKTELVWLAKECRRGPHPFITNVPMSGSGRPGTFKVCELTRMSIDSGYRCAVAYIYFQNPNDTSLINKRDREIILKKLRALKKYFAISVLEDMEPADGFQIRIELRAKDQFCDIAVKFAEIILRILGIEDFDRWKLASFKLTQTTYFRVDEKLIPFEHFLKHQHKLPVMP